MARQAAQGSLSRQPFSSSESHKDRITAWLHDKVPPWNAAQSSETQGALHAGGIASIVPPTSPLLSGSTSASSDVSDCSPQSRVPVPQPLGLSDPASLTGNTLRSTALLAGTGTWFAKLTSRPKKRPEACCPELNLTPQLRPDRRLNASFREILSDNPDYARRLSRAIRDLPLEHHNVLLDQSFHAIASPGGGDSTTRHHADSRRDSGGATPATQPPTTPGGASNKRKIPPGEDEQDPGKVPDDSSGSAPGGGSTGGPSKTKKPKTSDFLFLCPYRQVCHAMEPQRKFRACQPPGHLTDRSRLKKHLKEVHVRFPGSQNADLNPDYSMSEDLWNNEVVGVFDDAKSQRFPRGSIEWKSHEGAFYQKLCKTMLPNAYPMPTSPFYQDCVKGHPLVDEARRMLKAVFKEKADRAVQNGQVASAEDYRPSQEEAMDMMAIPLAAILSTSPQLSHRVNDPPQSQADSDRVPSLTEDTRSLTPATSSRGHVPSMHQGLPAQPTTTTQLPENTNQTPVASMNADQHGESLSYIAGNSQPDSPSAAFSDTLINTNIQCHPQPAGPASETQVYIDVGIKPSIFEVTLTGCRSFDYMGPQLWNIPVPYGLMVTAKQRQLERPISNGGPTMNVNVEPGISSANSQLPSTGDRSLISEDDYSRLMRDMEFHIGGELNYQSK